ncbi:MAG: hypothetical protein ACKO72_10945, partial [Actinomycetes bacterium]
GVALIPTYTDKGNALVPVAILALVLLIYGFFFPRRADWVGEVGVIDTRAGSAPGTGVAGVAEGGSGDAAVADLATRRSRRLDR